MQGRHDFDGRQLIRILNKIASFFPVSIAPECVFLLDGRQPIYVVGLLVTEGSNNYGKGEIYRWENVASVQAMYDQTVAVHKDGTVSMAGYNKSNQGNVKNWKNVIKVAGACYNEAAAWQDIADIYIGSSLLIGLRRDGSVKVAGKFQGLEKVARWIVIRLPGR